jgi:hypothetical protein
MLGRQRVNTGSTHSACGRWGMSRYTNGRGSRCPESWSSLRRRRPRFEKNGVGASSLDVLLCTRGVGNTAPVFRSCGAISDYDGRKTSNWWKGANAAKLS